MFLVLAAVSFLTWPEIDAVLAAPDRNTRAGRRDHTFLFVEQHNRAQTGSKDHAKRHCESDTFRNLRICATIRTLFFYVPDVHKDRVPEHLHGYGQRVSISILPESRS
jgi:hypothetical protein